MCTRTQKSSKSQVRGDDDQIQPRKRSCIPAGEGKLLHSLSLVKKCIRTCTIYNRFKVKAAQQETAPLPRDRVTKSLPFKVTGIHFAGPLYAKVMKTVEKVCGQYVVLFTCVVTRAVHLKLVPNMSTENFLQALKRFISRCGLCKIIYLDNVQTFKQVNLSLSPWTLGTNKGA